MKLYSFFIVIVTFSLYAMENHEKKKEVQDISYQFSLNSLKDEKILDFLPIKPDTLAYVIHSHDSQGYCINDFGNIDLNNNFFPKIQKQITGRPSAIKITSAGNLLLAHDGKVGFYISNTDSSKIFTKNVNSKIIALQHNIIIKNNDKKLCKAIAAVGANGDLLCIHDDNNFRQLNLFDLLSSDQKDHQNDKEIVIADIKPYSAGYELLPFIAYAVHYNQNVWLSYLENINLVPNKYSKSALVYNPILNKTIILNQAGKISDIRFLPNYNICVTSDDKSIVLFDTFKAEKLYTVQIPEESTICAGRILHRVGEQIKIVSCISSACGKYIATTDDSCNLSIWDSDTGARLYRKMLDTCSCDAVLAKMAFSCDGNSLYVCNKKNQKIYNIKDFITYTTLSPQEQGNAIRIFMHRQHEKKDTSILRVLRNRELGLRK